MADNQLIYKVVPTIITDGVTQNLPNSEQDYVFNKKQTLEGIIVSIGPLVTLSLPSSSTALTFAPFIELIASSELNLIFTTSTTLGVIPATLALTKYIAGNVQGFNFQISTLSLEEISFQWSFYTNE